MERLAFEALYEDEFDKMPRHSLLWEFSLFIKFIFFAEKTYEKIMVEDKKDEHDYSEKKEKFYNDIYFNKRVLINLMNRF